MVLWVKVSRDLVMKVSGDLDLKVGRDLYPKVSRYLDMKIGTDLWFKINGDFEERGQGTSYDPWRTICRDTLDEHYRRSRQLAC
jgi:hypothetical protein